MAEGIKGLRERLNCLQLKVNELEASGDAETDPVFTASAAFSITNQNKTDWTSAFSWGNHASAGYLTTTTGVDRTTNQTIAGLKQFNGSFNAASAIARGLYLTPTLIATANNDVLVGLDVIPVFTLGAFTGTSSFALRVTGISRFTGNITLAGDIIPEASGTRSLGSASLRLNNIYPTNILKGSAGSSMNMGLTNTSDIFLRVQPTTNNIHVQATGAAPTETNYKFTIDGTGASVGGLSVTGLVRFITAPTFADNTTAVAGGLLTGQIYKTAVGTLMIVL